MPAPTPPLGLLVTRPAEDGEATAQKLRARGYDPILSPLLTITVLADAPLPDLTDYHGLIVTSANGVRALAERTDRRGDLILAVGDHTAAKARTLGFTQVESASGDAVVLVNYVRDRLDPEDGKLLHVRGETIAVDPVPLLEGAGFTVDSCSLYRADPSEGLSATAITALAAGTVAGVLLYSPRSAKLFEAALTGALPPETAGGLTAYCLSPAVAKALSLPYRAVAVAPHPLGEALLGLLPKVPSAAREEIMSDTDRPTTAELPAPPPKRGASALVTGVIGGLIGAALVAGAGVATRDAWLPALLPTPAAPDRSLTLRVDALERSLAALPRPADEAALRADLDDLTKKLAALESRPHAAPQVAADDEAIAALRRRIEGFEQALRGTADASSLAALSERSARLSEQMADYLQRVTQARSHTEDTTRALVKQASLALAALRVSGAVTQGQPFADALRLLATLGAQDAELMTAIAGLDPLDAGVPTGEALRARLPALVTATKAAELAAGESGWRQEVARVTGHLITIRRTDVPVGDGLDARLAKVEAHLTRSEWDGALRAFDGASAEITDAATPFLDAVKARRDAERLAARLLDLTIAALAKVGP